MEEKWGIGGVKWKELEEEGGTRGRERGWMMNKRS